MSSDGTGESPVGTDAGLLLGKHAPPVECYSPQILYPIARAGSRAVLGLPLAGPLPFTGFDLWHAYELAWLDAGGKPVVAVGRLLVPAHSPNMVESKSLKLYLNSLNNAVFATRQTLVETVQRDIEKACGAPVTLELLEPGSAGLAGTGLAGECLDVLDVPVPAGGPAENLPEMAKCRAGADIVEQQLYSHLLRSLCPVTAQPDWASVWVHYRGPRLQPEALLRYLLAFRNHREFHEQCVERIFCDLMACARPELLTVQALYTRRGGLDINPMRSTEGDARPLPRLNRQ